MGYIRLITYNVITHLTGDFFHTNITAMEGKNTLPIPTHIGGTLEPSNQPGFHVRLHEPQR